MFRVELINEATSHGDARADSALPITGRAQSFDIKTHTLKNGMKTVVQEDHSIPNAAMYNFYRIGSRNGRPGTKG